MNTKKIKQKQSRKLGRQCGMYQKSTEGRICGKGTFKPVNYTKFIRPKTCMDTYMYTIGLAADRAAYLCLPDGNFPSRCRVIDVVDANQSTINQSINNAFVYRRGSKSS